MEVLKNFGFEPKLFFAQVVNFLIILVILRKLLYKPIVSMLKKREDTIKEGLQKAEEAQKTLEKALVEERKILKKAQSQATKIAEDTKNQTLEIITKSEESAKIQAEKIIREAKEQIAFETKQAEEKLTTHVSELAVKYLDKALDELFSEKEQKELMSKALKQIKQ